MTGCATDAPNREAAWHHPEAIHVGGDKGEKISPRFLQRSELSGHTSSALLFAVLLCERALSALPSCFRADGKASSSQKA